MSRTPDDKTTNRWEGMRTSLVWGLLIAAGLLPILLLLSHYSYRYFQGLSRHRQPYISTREYRDPATRQMMVATFTPVSAGQQKWALIAQQPTSEAYAPIRHLTLELGVTTGVLSLVALGIMIVLGHIRQRLRHANRELIVEINQRQRIADELRKQQQSLRQLLDVYEQHRQLIAYEIHDGLAQRLAAALMNFEGLTPSVTGTSPDAGRRFAAALELLRESLAESRRLMSGLRPAILDDFGVVAAVNQLVAESQIATGTEIEWSHQVNFTRLAPPLETALYRIIQESLANALRHSQSDRVRLRLEQKEQRICALIEDWGCGFDPQQADPNRFGLRGICERSELFGGHATIESSPGQGTRIRVELPVVEAATEASEGDIL